MKKSNIILLAALLLVLAGITVASVYFRNILAKDIIEGDGNIKKEQRNVSPFNRLNITGGFTTVYFLQDSKKELVIEGDSNILEYIKTHVENDELTISYSENIRAIDIIVHISQEKLDGVTLSSGSKFLTSQPVILDNIDLTASSGSRFKVDGIFEMLKMKLSSGANATLAGECKEFDIQASSGSNLNAKDFVAQNVNARASSGSNLEVHAVNTLSVNGSSGSSINYHGDPKLESINTSSGANLRKR